MAKFIERVRLVLLFGGCRVLVAGSLDHLGRAAMLFLLAGAAIGRGVVR